MSDTFVKINDKKVEESVVVSDVSKTFKMYYDKPQTLKEKILRLNSDKYDLYYALKKVDLTINRGEVVGIVGKNGCGKSTLLKMIAGILTPDTGNIQVNGRLSCLIELGAGFHPDFTGRENIYTNASIFGMSRNVIDKTIEEIIEFSELGEFIDNPVRTYSSGMYLKLAFSVAIHIHPEILLIDEILAVGDARFQRKCFQRLEEIKSTGATIIIVSHDLGSLEKFCTRVVWIHEGLVRMDGNPLIVTRTYQDYMLNGEENYHMHTEQTEPELVEAARRRAEEKEREANNRWGNKDVVIMDAFIRNAKGKRTTKIDANEEFTVEISYKVNKEQPEYNIGVGFYNLDDIMVFGTNTSREHIKIQKLQTGSVMRVHFKKIQLKAGKYHLHTSIIDKYETPLDFYRYYSDFEVVTSDTSAGEFLLDREWNLEV